MSSSPHLPPKSCSVPAFYVRQSLPWIFVVVIIAMLSGVAAGLATAAWVLPSLQSSNTTGALRGTNKQLPFISPDAILQKTVSQRVLAIYDKRLKGLSNTYAQNAQVGQAVVLSSDGWLVTQHVPNTAAQDEKNWELVDFQGVVYTPTEVIVDPVMHVAYIHIAVEGLPIISFRQQSGVQAGEVLWSWDRGDWSQVTVGQPTRTDMHPQSAVQIGRQYTVQQSVPVGSLLTDDNGHLAGIVSGVHTIIDIDDIERQLAPLLQGGALHYAAPMWKGYLIVGLRVDDSYTEQEGFVVTQADSLKSGDIVTVIDGKPIKSATFSRSLLDAPQTFPVVVIRDGQETVVQVTKKDLTPDDIRLLGL